MLTNKPSEVIPEHWPNRLRRLGSGDGQQQICSVYVGRIAAVPTRVSPIM